MSTLEIVELLESLPPEKREEVTDFARFLLSRQQDERWKTLIDTPQPRPRLDAFLREVAKEGSEAFAPRRL